MSTSVFADDLKIKGEVTSKGDIQLDGQVEGNVTARTITTSKDAKIKGSLTGEKVIVGGTFDGTINAVSAGLTATAKVKGEVLSNTLSVHEDAYFDGTAEHVENPLEQGKTET